MEMIATRNLTKKFGDIIAVDDLTFHVNKGEVFGLLGPNGAGKSTTVRMLCCLISKTEGDARIGEWDVSSRDDAMKIRKAIGYVPDAVGLIESMSAARNLEYFGRLYDCPDSLIHENMEKYLKLLDLWEMKDREISTFSKGMKQKVAMIRALVHDPEILILDEPTANLDPEASKTIRDLLIELRKENRTILLNTHNLDEAQRICTRIGLLKTRLLAMDTPQNLEKISGGRRTEISLNLIGDKILSAVKSRNPRNFEVTGNKLLITMDDPETERPGIIAAIVAAGGEIQSVMETGASLEAVYINLVRGEGNEP